MNRRRIIVAASLLALGCGASERPQRRVTTTAPQQTRPLDVLVEKYTEAQWHYDVRRQEDGDLLVEAAIRDAEGAALHVDHPAGRFIHDLEVLNAGKWEPVAGRDVPSCTASCRIRYRFALEAAAAEIGDSGVADLHTETVLSPPTAWLLRPSDDDKKLVFRVRGSADGFVTGLWPAEGSRDTYVGDAAMFWRAPYSAFGTFHRHERTLGASHVEVAVATGGRELDEKQLMTWLDRGMSAVETYFGQFPVPRALIIVLPNGGNRVNGKQLGGGGASILLWVGEGAKPAKLARDWVSVHEMVHLSHPTMRRQFLWLAEGLATYVEPLARAQAGHVTDEVVWRDMVRGMPNGQPAAGDRGIDRTQSWGRLYWGGALFAMVADVEIRKRTKGTKSLQHGLRAVAALGGHSGNAWSVNRFMKVCDEATGTTVMTEQYAAWSETPVTVDLEAMWADLGVHIAGGRVTFDDDAPLAALRRDMTRPL